MLFLFFIVSYARFTVFDNLLDDPKPGFNNWSGIFFNASHKNRQPNQPPETWTNLTFTIPYSVNAIQFISLEKEYTQEIPYFAVDELDNKLYVSFTWWGLPWKLIYGWSNDSFF